MTPAEFRIWYLAHGKNDPTVRCALRRQEWVQNSTPRQIRQADWFTHGRVSHHKPGYSDYLRLTQLVGFPNAYGRSYWVPVHPWKLIIRDVNQ